MVKRSHVGWATLLAGGLVVSFVSACGDGARDGAGETGYVTAPDMPEVECGEFGERWVDVDVGWQWACGLRDTGRVVCWGQLQESWETCAFGTNLGNCGGACFTMPSGSVGCIGDPDVASKLPELEVGDAYVEVAATKGLVGLGAFCAVRRNGGAVCIGDMAGHPVGSRPWNTPPSSGKLSHFVGGGMHVCGLDVGGRAICWGAGSAEGVPDSDNPPLHNGQAIPPPTPFVDLVALNEATCGLTAQGEVRCWGVGVPEAPLLDVEGDLVDVTEVDQSVCGLTSAGAVVCESAAADMERPPGDRVMIAGGPGTICAISSAGELDCWGDRPTAHPPTEDPG